MKTKRLEIKLEPKQYREMKKFARENNKISMGELVRQAVDYFIHPPK